MKKYVVATLMAFAAAGAFAEHPHEFPPEVARKLAHCEHCGVVHGVHAEKRKGEGGAVGVVGGAVVGGLLGNQIGGGNGKTLATVGGAVAGGFAGNEVQKRVTTKTVWVTEVRMKDGSLHKFEQAQHPMWKTGTFVKVEGRSLAVLAID